MLVLKQGFVEEEALKEELPLNISLTKFIPEPSDNWPMIPTFTRTPSDNWSMFSSIKDDEIGALVSRPMPEEN